MFLKVFFYRILIFLILILLASKFNRSYFVTWCIFLKPNKPTGTFHRDFNYNYKIVEIKNLGNRFITDFGNLFIGIENFYHT